MIPCPDDGELQRFLGEAVDSDTQATISAHVAGCGACQARLEALTDRPSLVWDPDTTAHFPKLTAPPTLLGTTLAGRYRLIKKLGEGGMGVVFEAEQIEPVRRTVAVKVLKSDLDSAGVLARFEAERQALAVLDHPNIAKILDAGESPVLGWGRAAQSFFVMEYVPGLPLITFCDQERLTIIERLQLISQICSAVQHAHQKGIIHRDLKPTNILVERRDGRPVPKVIDFGLAKATGATGLTDRSLLTAVGMVAGTPLYMAPEQAAGNSADIDTRADIYSLGVILFEMLTGSTPIDRETFKSIAIDELLRAIREREPPTPSSRISSQHNLPSVAALRRTEPTQLARIVRGELDWIVMKALEKDRGRRYATANAFAADIDRYLAGELVSAHPPSRIYLMRKFVRRHRGAVAAAVAITAALVAGLAGTTIGLLRANESAVAARLARDEAEERRREAERNADQARETGDFLKKDVLRLADPQFQQQAQSQGLRFDPNLTIREVIVHAAERIDGKFPRSPLAEADIRSTLAISLGGFGRYDLALPNIRRASEIYREQLGPDDPKSISALTNLGRSLFLAGQHAEAAKVRDESVDRAERVFGPDHPSTLLALEGKASSLLAANRFDDALKIRDRVIESRTRTLGSHHQDTLRALQAKANQLHVMSRYGEAIALVRDVLEKRTQHLSPEHTDTVQSMNTLATLLDETNQPQDALSLRENVFKIRTRKLGEDHPDTMGAALNLCVSLTNVGRHDEAIALSEKTLGLQTRKLGESHQDTLLAWSTLGNAFAAAKRHDDALRIRERSAELHKSRLGPESINTLAALNNLANTYEALKRHDDAYRIRLLNAETRIRVLGPLHRDSLSALWNIIGSLVDLGRHDEALVKITELLALAEQAQAARKSPHPFLVDNMHNYRLTIFIAKKDLAACREIARAYEALPTAPWRTFWAARLHCRIAGMLADIPAEAKAELDRAIALLEKSVATDRYTRRDWDSEPTLEPLRSRDDYKALRDRLRP